MKIFKILSILLCYPENRLRDAIPAIRDYLGSTDTVSALEPLLHDLQNMDLIELQEDYVQTFDRNPSHSLHLFEHLHGEDRIRGQALSDLLTEYQKEGVTLSSGELPDYLPLFLEFLALCNLNKAEELLGSAIHIIAHIGRKLKEDNSRYTCIFRLLEQLSPVEPELMRGAPIRDMDDLIEKIGLMPDGSEPLLPFGNSGNCTGCPTGAVI